MTVAENKPSGDNEGTTGEAIGRPGPWKEGRYEREGQPVHESVRTPPGSTPNPDQPASTPVTRKDYVLPGAEPDIAEPPGGDAG
jgi:hypothetical protein